MPKVYLDTGQRSESIRYDTIDISGKFTQFYDDLGEVLYQIHSPCALHMIYWMSQNMGDYNQIFMGKGGRRDFTSSCISNGGKRYSDSTIKYSLNLLVKKRLVIPMSDPGKRTATYFVNPYYFWKTGSQRDRTESIKGYIYKIKEHEGN